MEQKYEDIPYHAGTGLNKSCTAEAPATTHQQLYNAANRMERVINSLGEMMSEMRGEGLDPTNDLSDAAPPMIEVYKGSSGRLLDLSDRLENLIDQLRGDLLR